MPVQKGKSLLVQKYGNKVLQAADAHKDDEVVMGNVDLPAGIENGIAQLVDCRFDTVKPGKTNAGEVFFIAAGIVKSPSHHGGTPIEGLRTSIMEMVCDTPGRTRATVEDHVKWIQNEMKKLGVTDSAMLAGDKLEETAAMLKAAKPHFRFRTWKGQKATSGQYAGQEPRTNHQWAGVVDFSANGEAPAVDDQTGDDGAGEPEPPAFNEFSWTELAAVADDENAPDENRNAAVEQLKAAWDKAGHSQEDWDDATSFAVVAKKLEEGDGAEPAADEQQEAAPPSKGDLYKYKWLDPSTKRKKNVEVEVVSVDKKGETVTLKLVDTKKMVVGPNKRSLDVPWAELEISE